MKYLFLISIIIVGFTLRAQQDEKAKPILDKLSKKTKSYKTIEADFQFTMINTSDNLNETQEGSIMIKGNSYQLSISGQTIISDGKNIWTILKDAEEVQITEIDEEDEEAISPNKIFTLYEKGFKYKYMKEENGFDVINLYPKNATDKNFHRITLYINKNKNEINKVEVFGKDGTKSIYKIKSFATNTSIPSTEFIFDKTKYSNFEIIDLR